MRNDIADVLTVASGLVYFVLFGTGTVAIALAAHLR
jgi:phosphosulfolactate synthase (CoM biosynthesis protein A)